MRSVAERKALANIPVGRQHSVHSRRATQDRQFQVTGTGEALGLCLVRRSLVERLPFWEMKPADDLVSGAAAITVTRNRGRNKYQIGPQVFAKPGHVYAVYFPIATATGQIDLSAATTPLTLRWYDPQNGEFQGQTKTLPPSQPSHSAFRRQMSTRIGSR